MSKKQNAFKGLTAQDIMNIDVGKFNKMNKTELRQAVERLASVGNKRLKSFENGSVSPSVQYIRAHGGKFSTKNKNINELRAEFIRAKGFLSSSTSTKAGWKKVRTDSIQKLQARGLNVNEANYDKFWKTYERLKEIDHSVGAFKYEAMKAVDRALDGGSDIESATARAQAEFQKIYEESAGLNDDISLSDFFELK